MARQYSPKSFLRRAPNELLRRYLKAWGLGDEIPWQQLSETNVEPVFQAIQSAPENVRSQIEADFRDIEVIPSSVDLTPPVPRPIYA